MLKYCFVNIVWIQRRGYTFQWCQLSLCFLFWILEVWPDVKKIRPQVYHQNLDTCKPTLNEHSCGQIFEKKKAWFCGKSGRWTEENVETAWGDCPNTHSSGLEEHVACTRGAPRRGMLLSVRILYLQSLISIPPIIFFQNSYPSLQTTWQRPNISSEMESKSDIFCSNCLFTWK